MGYAIAVAVGLIVGAVAAWIYKAKAQAALQRELASLKNSAVNAANKL